MISPELVLTMWAAGVAGGVAVVAWWRVVGKGFIWLAGGVAFVLGGLGAWAGSSTAAYAGAGAVLAGVIIAGRQRIAAALFAVGAVLFVVAAWQHGDSPSAVTGALAAGAVTSEMLLGHWYLIDPTLPRWALRRLAYAAGAGLAADTAFVGVEGGFDFSGSDAVVGLAFVVLAATTLVLMVAVWFALREPSYPGVMAATGLSYLAVMTTIGAVVAGRSLLEESGSVLAVTLSRL